MRLIFYPLTALAFLLLAAVAALADEATKDIALTLSPPEVNYIFAVLVKQPYGDVVGLLNKMQAQVQKQADPPKPAEGPKDPPKK